uniref:Ig-like domain-containing protein n=1 Tax=Leptobrachium leishanense TaxID=445787 RepID=A0A8C5PFT3_9ANUR
MYLKLFCILCLASLSAGSHEVVVMGVPGSRVTLPCKMTQKQLNTRRMSERPAASLQWHKIERESIKVLSVETSGVAFTSRALASRASVRPTLLDSGDFSLHLENLQKHDAGKYEALATYGKVKQNCTVELRTIEVTQSPTGHVPENSSVTLTCSIDGEKPPMDTVRWLHQGVPISSSRRHLISGGSLYLKGLTQADRGNWSCCGEKGGRASLTLQVLGITGSTYLTMYAAIGSRVELPCMLTDIPQQRLPAIHWHNVNNAGIWDGKRQVLVLHHVSRGDAGKYRCDVTYNGHTLNRWVDLKVIQVSPPGPGFIREGSSLQLKCNVPDSELGEEYEWMGQSTQSGHREVKRGPVLYLSSVQNEDAGLWNCSVYGKKGRILGNVQYMLHVHAARTGSLFMVWSWQTYVILVLAFLLVLGFAAIAALSVRNRKRRLSHLAALTTTVQPGTLVKKSLSL